MEYYVIITNFSVAEISFCSEKYPFHMKFDYCMTFILNIDKKDHLEVGIKSVKTRPGTASVEKTPVAVTRRFQGQVTPSPTIKRIFWR